MSSSDRPGMDPLGGPAEPALAAPADGGGTWLDRVQRARGRHAAITRNLNTWSSYKSWSEQVRGAWELEERKK